MIKVKLMVIDPYLEFHNSGEKIPNVELMEEYNAEYLKAIVLLEERLSLKAMRDYEACPEKWEYPKFIPTARGHIGLQ
jgi:hypothetical protein